MSSSLELAGTSANGYEGVVIESVDATASRSDIALRVKDVSTILNRISKNSAGEIALIVGIATPLMVGFITLLPVGLPLTFGGVPAGPILMATGGGLMGLVCLAGICACVASAFFQHRQKIMVDETRQKYNGCNEAILDGEDVAALIACSWDEMRCHYTKKMNFEQLFSALEVLGEAKMRMYLNTQNDSEPKSDLEAGTTASRLNPESAKLLFYMDLKELQGDEAAEASRNPLVQSACKTDQFFNYQLILLLNKKKSFQIDLNEVDISNNNAEKRSMRLKFSDGSQLTVPEGFLADHSEYFKMAENRSTSNLVIPLDTTQEIIELLCQFFRGELPNIDCEQALQLLAFADFLIAERALQTIQSHILRRRLFDQQNFEKLFSADGNVTRYPILFNYYQERFLLREINPETIDGIYRKAHRWGFEKTVQACRTRSKHFLSCLLLKGPEALLFVSTTTQKNSSSRSTSYNKLDESSSAACSYVSSLYSLCKEILDEEEFEAFIKSLYPAINDKNLFRIFTFAESEKNDALKIDCKRYCQYHRSRLNQSLPWPMVSIPNELAKVLADKS